MGRTAKSAANSKSESEAQFELKFPILDFGSHRQATEDTVIDCSAQISVHIEYSTEEQIEVTCTDLKRNGVEDDVKSCGSDHVHANKMCALMGCKKGSKKGCKECCAILPQQPQNAKSVEDSTILLSKKIHEATLNDDWHSVEVSEYNGCTDTDMKNINERQEQLSMCGEENFELVDGVLETRMIRGHQVQEWKDTMRMVDGGSQGSSKALKELWLGD